MNKLLKYFLLFISITLLAGCDTMNLGGSNPDGVIKDKSDIGNDSDKSPEIRVDQLMSTTYYVGDDEPDWRTYFFISDPEDGELPVEYEMLTWNPDINMFVAGEYSLSIAFTDTGGNEVKSTISISVIDEKAPNIWPIIDLSNVPSEVTYGEQVDFLEHVLIRDDLDGDVEIKEDYLQFSPEFDALSPGEYTLIVSYTNSVGNESKAEWIVTVLEQDNSSDDTETQRQSLYPEIVIDEAIPTILEYGLTAEDWTIYFTITDEDDGEVEAKPEMLSWEPAFDYNEPGLYVLSCSYTNSIGYETTVDIEIEVLQQETVQDEVIVVEIVDNDLKNNFVVNALEPDWTIYFSIHENEEYVETTADMISFTPELDMAIAGEYVLKVEYVDSMGEIHSQEKTIMINTESQYSNLESKSIYELIYNVSAFELVKVEGLEVVAVHDQKLIASLNQEYILIDTFLTQNFDLASSISPGDVINVVGEIYKSAGFSISLELWANEVQIVSRGNPISERLPAMISIEDVSEISDLEFLIYLRETVAIYDDYSEKIGGLTIFNDNELLDGVSYKIEFVLLNHYEGLEPQIFILNYEEFEEEVAQETVTEYALGYIYSDGDIVEVTFDVAFVNETNIIVGYVHDPVLAYAHAVIIDTSNTEYGWLLDSLVEGGRVTMNVIVEKTDNNVDGYGFVLKPHGNIVIGSADMIYFNKTYGVGSVYATSPVDYAAELQYSIETLGIIPVQDQELVYEMSATYDSSNNTFGGLNVSPLGVQLLKDGEYSVQFMVLNYFEQSPFAEVLILAPYYSTPTEFSLSNEIITLRNLTVSTNNEINLITAINDTLDVTININVTDIQVSLLESILVGDVINVVGVVVSDGLTDTTIDITAIELYTS